MNPETRELTKDFIQTYVGAFFAAHNSGGYLTPMDGGPKTTTSAPMGWFLSNARYDLGLQSSNDIHTFYVTDENTYQVDVMVPKDGDVRISLTTAPKGLV